MDIRIDEELQSLIPPLAKDEYETLEKLILEEGVREPLVVWAGHGILVDGHNRYRICQEHGLPFGIREKKFADRSAVIDYMYENQTGRRNLTPGQKSTLELDVSEAKMREEAKKKQAKGIRNLKQYSTGSDQLVGTDDVQDSQPEPSDDGDPDPQVVNLSTSPPDKKRENETAYRLAKRAGVGVGTMKRTMEVKKSGDQELYDKLRSGEMSVNAAYTEVKKREHSVVSAEIEPGQAVLHAHKWNGSTTACDLLITELPRLDDGDSLLPEEALYKALFGVRQTGHAYVFVDPDPETLCTYLSADLPTNVELCQVLVWSFDYILGNNDWSRYKPSWKAILFYRGIEAKDLRFPYLKERNAVHSVNAEGGGLGDKEFKLRMPIELAKRLISQSTQEGDLVFDPFAKEGTFLVAAAELGRDAIGYEDDESLVELAASRKVKVEKEV